MNQPHSILITGSSGFVGGALLRACLRDKWDVLGIGRRPHEKLSENVPKLSYLSFDLTHPFEESGLTRSRSFDVVVHAAALSSPWGSRKDFYENNVLATKNLLQYCRSNNLPRFIFISSTSVFYRCYDQFDITEKTPFAEKAVNRYSASKQEAERLVREYPGDWCILRPRAVFGYGDTVLFPRILAAARAGRFPLLLRKGEPVVSDMLSINNLVHYILTAACTPGIQDDFNLTDGNPVAVIDLLLDVFRRLDIPFPKRKMNTKTAFHIARGIEWFYSLFRLRQEPPITQFGVHAFAYSKTFDISKAISRFGKPPVPYEESVERFIQWIENEQPY